MEEGIPVEIGIIGQEIEGDGSVLRHRKRIIRGDRGIIRAIDRDGDDLCGAVLGADGEGLGEAVGSAELLDGALAVVGGIGPGAGGIDGQGAEGSGEGLGDEPVLAGIGVDDGEIAGIGKGAHAGDGDVLGDRAGGIAGDDGHVGHGGDGAIDSTGIGGIAVGDDIIEADGAVIVGVRGERHHAHGINGNSAVGDHEGLGTAGEGDAVDALDGKRIPVKIGIIGQEVQRDGPVLRHRKRIIRGNRGIIDSSDGAIDSTGVGGIAVGDDIVEADGAVIVGVGGERHHAHGVDGNSAVGHHEGLGTAGQHHAVDRFDGEGIPSRSVSLARRSSVTDPSSATVNGSSVATGALLTAVTVPLTVPVSVALPSVTT